MKKIYLLLLMGALLITGCGGRKSAVLSNISFPIKEYAKTEKMTNISLAMTIPSINISTNFSDSLFRGLEPRLKHDTNALYCTLSTELERLLISKGFTINNIFKSQNDMTFTEKRNTSALLYPVININLQENTISRYNTKNGVPLDANGELVANGSISIYMTEPLSNEKIWVKNINISDFSVPIKYQHAFSASNLQVVPKAFVGAARDIDRLYIDVYEQILQAVSRHISSEEFEMLDSDIKKLKEIKRY